MARRLGGAALSSLPLLLSPAEASSLARSRPVSFLDASWHMPGSPRKAHAEYTTGPRIPNAAFFDVDKVATVPYRVPARSEVADAQGLVSLPHMLPTPDRFGRALADLGVPEHAHIVAYDSVGVFSAPRLVWECQVMGRSASLLNGGLPRWIAEGHTVEDGPPRPASAGNSPTPERVQASALAEHVASYEDMVSNAASKEVDRAEVLDARSTERWALSCLLDRTSNDTRGSVSQARPPSLVPGCPRGTSRCPAHSPSLHFSVQNPQPTPLSAPSCRRPSSTASLLRPLASRYGPVSRRGTRPS